MSADPARWARVKEVFQAALDQPPQQRRSFARDRCGEDGALLAEVESLLAAHEHAGEFVERPAIAAFTTSLGRGALSGDGDPIVPVLEPGRRLGPYEVVDAIGRGGMGEVYRARDSRLGRIVAVKVLPAHVAASADLKQRFEREARTLATISHPHICPVFDVGAQDGIDYLVMEHLEGETLAERLRRGPLPLDQALRHATEIADALDQAHRRGIVHRDLKPGNIVLTTRGAVLLDFGLAKRTGVGLSTGHTAAGVPTAPLTAVGTIVGTLHYMSPEQLQGKEADARSDIFALGAVVYEMVTGIRAFDGDSAADIVAAVLEREPAPLSMRQPVTPHRLDRVVKSCLAKDPDHRWQSAGDLMRELMWIREDRSQSSRSAPLAQRRRSLEWALGGLALGALVVAGVWALSAEPATSGPKPIVRSVITTAEGVPGPDLLTVRSLAVSPDGSRLVYSSPLGGPLRVHAFDQLEPEPLEGTDGGSSPVFSPDGSSVAFFDERTRSLKRISIRGGPTSDVAATKGPLVGLSWGANDMLVFATEYSDGLYRVSARGGSEPERLTIDRTGREQPLDAVPGSYGRLRVSPDGSRMVSARGAGGRSEIWIANTDRPVWNRLLGAQSPSGFGSYSPIWTPDGQRIVFQNEAGRLVSAPAGGVGAVEPLLTMAGTSLVSPTSWTPDGKGLLFIYGSMGAVRIGLVSIEVGGDGMRPWRLLIDRDAKASGAAVSPNGNWVVYQSFDSGKYEVYVERFPELDGRQPVSGSEGGFNPVWSRDGTEVFYRRLSDGAMMAVRMQSATALAVGRPELLFNDPRLFNLTPPRPGGPAD